jgi:chromosome segregation ATPase
MKEKLEAEILLAMDLAEEKEVLISEMETRQAELRAQVDTLKEKSSMNSAKVSALEQKLKENSEGERERLQVLQTENKRLEKRLKDTWTALQGAHAVVEQTKEAAKEAVRKANSAAARAESVALKARQELSEARGGAKSLASIPSTSGSPVSHSQSQATSARSTPFKRRSANVGLDDEMQRANALLSRISRSRESSVKDDESFGRGGGGSDNGNTAVFGYRGAQ